MKFLDSDEQGIVRRLVGGIGGRGVNFVRDALSKMSLGDPTDFVLQLVAAAVAGGASFIDLNSDGLDFVMEFDGTPLSSSQLQNLFGGLESNLSDLQVRKMALGLNAAFATEIDQILVETWNGTNGVRLTLSPSNQNSQVLRVNPLSDGKATTRIRFLERNKIRKVTRFVTRFQGSLPECEALKERCPFAGPTISVNKAKVNQMVEFGPCLSWVTTKPAKPIPALELRTLRPRKGNVREEESTGPYYAVLCLGSRFQEQRGLRIVAGGTTIPTGEDLGYTMASVVASAFGLEADPSHSQPLRNQVYENLVQILRHQLMLMALQLLDQKQSFDSEEWSIASSVFFDLAVHLMERERLDVAERALRASIELKEKSLGPNHPDLLDGYGRLAELAKKRGDKEAVAELHRKQIPLMRLAAENHLNKYRAEEAANLFRKALELEDELEPPPPGLAGRYQELAVLMKEHRLPGAESMFMRALALQESQPEAVDDGQTVDVLRELADRYRVNKQYAEAESTARRALAMAEEKLGDRDQGLVPILKLLAETLKAAGRYAEATDYESRAVMIRFKRS